MDFGFHEQMKAEERAYWRSLVGDLDRTVSVWEDGELVGTGAAFDFEMTVPGAAPVPVGGVTMITVKPTHRRRGVLTSMLKDQLDSWHGSGRYPVAILTASEAGIYGRFGYGVAVHTLGLSIPRGDNGLSQRPWHRQVPRSAWSTPRPPTSAARRSSTSTGWSGPGMLSRTPGWRTQALDDDEWRRKDRGPQRVVVAESPDGIVEAYARYRVKEDYSQAGRPGCTVHPSGTCTAPGSPPRWRSGASCSTST